MKTIRINEDEIVPDNSSDKMFLSPSDRIKQLEIVTAKFEDGTSYELVYLEDVLRVIGDIETMREG